MDCKVIQNHLSAYLENTLSGIEKDSITMHLSSCKNCRQQLEWLVILDNELKSMAEETPKPFLFTRIKARMEDEKPVLSMWQPAGYTVAASLVMGLMVGILIGKLTVTKTETTSFDVGITAVFDEMQIESNYQIPQN